MTVATYTRPNNTAQTASQYKANIDGDMQVYERIAGAFAPHAQSSPNMTVRVDAGALLSGTTLTEVAAQNTGTITAPGSNSRIDRVVIDSTTGAVSVITGTPGVSPAVPALTAGKLPIAQVLLTSASTSITNSMITDERVPTGSGSSSVAAAVRQTVLNGTVDSSGLPNFGGSTGSTTVTQANTLTVAAANGFNISGAVDRIGQKTNPSWTGLSTNGTMYLGVTVNSDGTLTEFSTTLAPVYQWGGTFSVTNNQRTFNIQQMQMQVGNGSTASQSYDVFVGEVTVAGGVVTAITWYALMARYDTGYSGNIPAASTRTSYNHNLGIVPKVSRLMLKCGTAEQNFSIGDEITPSLGGATVGQGQVLQATTKTIAWTTGSSNSVVVNNATTGALTALTSGNWTVRMIAERGW